MELILIRHGLPEMVVRKNGEPADPPLSSVGHEQAARMAERMQREAIDRLYSSPLRRAHQTAVPLGKMAQKEIEVEEGVAEYDRKEEDYIPVEQLKKLDYERWRRLMKGEMNVDFDTFSRRVIQALEQIVMKNKGKRVAVISHGGVINVWTAHVIGFRPRLFFYPDYTSINQFRCSSAGDKSVITLNEAVHLRDVHG